MTSGEPETIFLKLGGSLITDKTRREVARIEVLSRLAGEIAEARRQRPTLRLLLGHGSGSFGHFAAREYRTREGIRMGEEAMGWYGYAVTGAVAATLNRLVIDSMLRAGVPAVSFPPSASARCEGRVLRDLHWESIVQALERGLVPVVYGDVALDDLQGCTIVSTEEVFDYLADIIRPTRILLAGTVDGVYTSDPLRDGKAIRIPVVRLGEPLSGISGSHGVDVTGGMATKVAGMLRIVERMPALRVHVFSGENAGAVFRALADPRWEGGTVLSRWDPNQRSAIFILDNSKFQEYNEIS